MLGEMKYKREAIDRIDNAILELLHQRLSLAQEIGKIKHSNSQEIVDLAREEEILERLSQKGLLTQEQIAQIYQAIFAVTQRYQKDFR